MTRFSKCSKISLLRGGGPAQEEQRRARQESALRADRAQHPGANATWACRLPRGSCRGAPPGRKRRARRDAASPAPRGRYHSPARFARPQRPRFCCFRLARRARACHAPVLDVQAAKREVRVSWVIDNVLLKRSLLFNLVQRQHRHTVACAGHAAGRHDVGHSTGDADAHGHCALGAARSVRGTVRRGCSAARALPRRAGAHGWACCRCRRSWDRRRSAATATAPAERARGAPSAASPLPGAASLRQELLQARGSRRTRGTDQRPQRQQCRRG